MEPHLRAKSGMRLGIFFFLLPHVAELAALVATELLERRRLAVVVVSVVVAV